VPTLAAPFLFSAVLLGLAALLLLLLLRPDPAVVARDGTGDRGAPGSQSRRIGIRAALPVLASRASGRLGVAAMAVGHLVMVGVMAMTPVHIRSAGHDAAHTLGIVGTVISFHVAGMYAFSPVVGWLADRFGRRPIVLAGFAVLLLACAVAGSAGHDSARLAAGLTLLGLGWSATMVAGSTLVSESVPPELRPSAQGLSDLTMGVAGAAAGAVSGVAVDAWGYPALTALAASLIVLASSATVASAVGVVLARRRIGSGA
jgi:MFS family permease